MTYTRGTGGQWESPRGAGSGIRAARQAGNLCPSRATRILPRGFGTSNCARVVLLRISACKYMHGSVAELAGPLSPRGRADCSGWGRAALHPCTYTEYVCGRWNTRMCMLIRRLAAIAGTGIMLESQLWDSPPGPAHCGTAPGGGRHGGATSQNGTDTPARLHVYTHTRTMTASAPGGGVRRSPDGLSSAPRGRGYESSRRRSL